MPNSAADVSVVVPCFRCGNTIERCIRSVLGQTLRPKELILVDDASGDETLSLLQGWQQRYPQWIRVVALPVNQGAGMARNAGWQVSSGRFVAFLDSDDSWHPQKLEVQHAYMVGHPDVSLSGHGHAIEDRVVAPEIQKPAAQPIAPWRLLAKNPFVTPSVMLRADLPQRFEPGRRYMEDHLLWLEVVLSGGKVVRLDAPLVTLHKGQVGVSGLSSHVSAMSKADFGNYLVLYRKGMLGLVALWLCWAWAAVKLSRRAVVFGIPRAWKRWRHG